QANTRQSQRLHSCRILSKEILVAIFGATYGHVCSAKWTLSLFGYCPCQQASRVWISATDVGSLAYPLCICNGVLYCVCRGSESRACAVGRFEWLFDAYGPPLRRERLLRHLPFPPPRPPHRHPHSRSR